MKKSKSLEKILSNLSELNESKPDPLFKINTRKRLLNYITSPQPILTKKTSWFFKPLRYIAATSLAFLVSGAGIAFASQSSLPSDPLYPIKTATEQVAIAAVPTQQLKTDLALKVVERRAEELRQLEQQGKTDLIERGLNGYKQSIEEVKEVGHLDDDQINKKLPEASKAVKDIEKDEKDALPNTQKSEPEIEGASKQIPLSAPTLIIEQAPPEISPNRAITPSGGSSQQTPAISPPINNSQSPHPDNNSNRPSENQSPKQDSPNPQGHTRNNGNGKK